MYWASDVLAGFTRALGIEQAGPNDSDWKADWEGGFVWWPAGVRQEVGLRLGAPPWDSRLFVTTYLGTSGGCRCAPSVLTEALRNAVLSGVTPIGGASGEIAYTASFRQPDGDEGVVTATKLLLAAAAAQLRLCLDFRNRYPSAGVESAEPLAPHEAVEKLLAVLDTNATAVIPSAATLELLRLIIGGVKREVTVTPTQIVGGGSVERVLSEEEVAYNFTLTMDVIHPRIGHCVEIELDFPGLVSAYLPPPSLAASLTGLALADPDAPEIIGAWSPGERIRYTALIPAGVVSSGLDLLRFVVSVRDQSKWLFERVLDTDHGFEATLNWFGPYGWSASTSSEADASARRREGTGIAIREESAPAASGVPDDAVKVARVSKHQEDTGCCTEYHYLISHTELPAPEWVLWVRVVDSDDPGVGVIGLAKECRALARCESPNLDDASAAAVLLRSVWLRHGAMGAGWRDASEYEVEGSTLLPQGVVESLLDDLQAEWPAA